MKDLLRLSVLLLGAFALGFVSGADPARAGSLTVSSTASEGPMTLREAIQEANSNSGADVITFDPSVFPLGNPATIALEDPLPEIDGGEEFTLDGSNAGVILDGSGLESGSSGLVVTSGNGGVADVVIREITLREFPDQGLDVCGGGLPDCLREVGSLRLDDVTATGNGQNGIRVRGAAVHDMEIVRCESMGSGEHGVYIKSLENMSRVAVESCQADSNGNTGIYGNAGLYVESIGAIIDFSLVDSSVSGNGSLGAHFDSVEDTVRPVIDNVEAMNNGQLGLGFSSAQPLTGLLFTDSRIDGNGSLNGNGVGTEVLAFDIIDATITGNSFSNNVANSPVGGVGFQIYSQFERPSGLTITNNTVTGNVGRGISVITDTPGSQLVDDAGTVSENLVSGNTGDGVFVHESNRITISQNRIFGNGKLGINLRGGEDEEETTGVTPNDQGDGDQGSNNLLNFPVLNGVAGDSVQGTACASCTVELFVSDNDPTGHGEGRWFIGDAVATGGAFSIPVCGVSAGGKVTATATDSSGNTSEFSENYVVPFDTDPCPGQFTQGDMDCNGEIDGQDALMLALAAAGLPADTPDGCVALNSGSSQFGDVNCDGVVDALDLLGPLTYFADVPFEQESGCTDIGDAL